MNSNHPILGKKEIYLLGDGSCVQASAWIMFRQYFYGCVGYKQPRVFKAFYLSPWPESTGGTSFVPQRD